MGRPPRRQCLVELKLASEEAIVDALAVKFGFEVAQLDRLEPYAFAQAKALVPQEYATRNSIFPISADTGTLAVAMSDPTNLALTDELAFRSGKRVKVCIAGENAIASAVQAHYGADARRGARLSRSTPTTARRSSRSTIRSARPRATS